MARTKSLLHSVRFAYAQKKHSCKSSSKHIILKGDLRLEVKNERNWDKYCVECAAKILDHNQSKLYEIISEFEDKKSS